MPEKKANQKKPLSATQKKNKYRTLQFTCIGGEVLSVLTPFIILGAANYQEWFVSEEGWKIGLGGSLALALMGIAIFMVTKKKDDESKFSNGWITLLVGWFAVAFIFILLANIMDQIATIMLWGGLGLCGAFGFDLLSKNCKKKADAYKEALSKVKQESIEEEAKREVEKEQEQKEEQQATE